MARSHRRPQAPTFVCLVAITCLGCASEPLLVDEAPDNGFAIYRSGRLSRAELERLCRDGLDEIVVLDGQGAERECALRDQVCPGLRVRYDHRQEAAAPVSVEFVAAFDDWVEQGRRRGRRLAFRCRHGWHRAGRLSAYYRIRFQGVEPEEAIDEMLEVGHFMGRHPYLPPQVEALADLAHGRACSTPDEYCPGKGSPAREGIGVDGRFRADVCP